MVHRSALFLIALARGLDSPPAIVARLHTGLLRAAEARETTISLAQRVKVWPSSLASADRQLRARVTSLCTSHGLAEPVFGKKPGQAIKVKIGRMWHFVPPLPD